MNSSFDIAVIGAGAAGLMSAYKASDAGASVLLLEKMEKPARKIRISGKGRCNITNIKPEDEFLQNIYPNPRFFRPSFRNFSNTQLVDFLNSAGLPTVTERGGRVFPASQDAWDVAETLIKALGKKVTVECHAKVTALHFDREQRIFKSLDCEKDRCRTKISAKACILATGGRSYPLTGSTGDGYAWAEQAGHTIVATRPSLTGLVLDNCLNTGKLTMRNVELSLLVDGSTVQSEFGEMEFTDDGISGPIVLKISRRAVDALIAGKKTGVKINFKPALNARQLDDRIQRELSVAADNATVVDLLKTLLPSTLVRPFINCAGLPDRLLRDLRPDRRKRIIEALTALHFNVSGYRPFSEAIVTAGGVSLNEVNPKTLCSKIISNLFFAGEILDLDANTGGYNLQIAFSTGYLAGLQAAKYCETN
jgi:predicted Rossmann fold flavoprotein